MPRHRAQRLEEAADDGLTAIGRPAAPTPPVPPRRDRAGRHGDPQPRIHLQQRDHQGAAAAPDVDDVAEGPPVASGEYRGRPRRDVGPTRRVRRGALGVGRQVVQERAPEPRGEGGLPRAHGVQQVGESESARPTARRGRGHRGSRMMTVANDSPTQKGVPALAITSETPTDTRWRSRGPRASASTPSDRASSATSHSRGDVIGDVQRGRDPDRHRRDEVRTLPEIGSRPFLVPHRLPPSPRTASRVEELAANLLR